MATDATVAEYGNQFLAGLLERMGLDGIEIALGPARRDTLVFELTGDIEFLEQRPELTSALTLLLSQAASRKIDARVSCLLDIGGRFAEREALLGVLARDVAHAVEITGRIGVIDRLDSSDRRVVHTALADWSTVATQSEGENRTRRLTVIPAEG